MSSTLGELADERRAVCAIEALRLTPVMFELGPGRSYPPRKVYQQYLAQSDVFIGLYWQRYGQPAPGMQVSGLEEEFDLSGALPPAAVRQGAAGRDPRWAICWPASRMTPRRLTGISAPPPSWAGWCVMTWRCC